MFEVKQERRIGTQFETWCTLYDFILTCCPHGQIKLNLGLIEFWSGNRVPEMIAHDAVISEMQKCTNWIQP